MQVAGKQILFGALVAAATGTASHALAQTEPNRWPTVQEIERARIERPLPALTTIPQPPALPRIPGESTAQAPGLDIAALARQGSDLAKGATGASAPPPAGGLRIFVTLEMPRGSLQRLVDQAERGGATLVLRGLRNQSMRQTLAAVSELLGSRKVGWQIDPEAFERFGVQSAPTFVLPVAGTTQMPAACTGSSCVAASGFVAVAGDVSLDYALDHMARRHPQAAALAAPHLARLRSP